MLDIQKTENIRAVGVIILGLMGDVLMRTPVLRELRKALPRAQITCIVDPIGAEVLALTGGSDEIITTRRGKTPRLQYYQEKIRLFYLVANRKFDLMIDLYGGSSSRILLKASCARIQFRAEFLKASANIPLATPPDIMMKFTNPFHLSNSQLGVMKFFYYSNQSFDTTPWCLNEKIKASVSTQRFYEQIKNRKFFIISMGSGDPRKTPARERISDLVKHLHNQYQLHCLIVRNPGQEWLQDGLSDLLYQSNIDHSRLPILPLADLAWLMQRAFFCAMPDSGLYHLALGVRTPTLGFFTHTNPELVRPAHQPYEICFREDPIKGLSTMHRLPYGTQDLSSQELILAADRLIRKLA